NARPFNDPSVRYRCFNMSQELTRRGYRSEVVSQLNFERSFEELDSYDAYIFHRPYLNSFLADFLAAHKDRCIADFDDFIFDVRFADQTPMVRVRGGSSAATRSYVASTAEAASMFSRFTVSTAPLKAHCERLFEGVTEIIPNSVDRGFVGSARVIRRNSRYQDRPYALGYFSGTATHDLDLVVAAPAIAKFLKANRGARMLVVGPVKMPQELSAFSAQINVQDLVPYHRLPRIMAQCKRVIAPLEDTVFTRSKSGLKFFEAALVGCDVVATPIPDIDRFDSSVLFKCQSAQEWEEALTAPCLLSESDREEAIRSVEDMVRIEASFSNWRSFVGVK
ncbi:MAG: glycosyltransferase, partial [Proteobacteria bacterium]|nr:glycosyltransferase [Pseudomonadota bacterium]